ncbi:MAG: hypothetical protein KGI49_03715 [Patescibacteria group bacterium]|nr:hypothetical protein [Patescibacteria group bacterium]
MSEGAVSKKFDFSYAERGVLFDICDCSLDKRLSFYSLNREQADRFLKRLKHIRKMNWGQFMALDRERGVTPEIPGSDSYVMIDSQNTSDIRLGENYYYHFRVEQKGLFRVFGYQFGQLFCITHIDPDGRIHH